MEVRVNIKAAAFPSIGLRAVFTTCSCQAGGVSFGSVCRKAILTTRLAAGF
jgi:hypothetical protein